MKNSFRILAPLALLVPLIACSKEEPTKAPEAPAKPAAPAAQVYTCKAHPEVALAAPGKCPTCGAELTLKQSFVRDTRARPSLRRP